MRLLHITASNVWRGHEQQIVYYYDEFQDKIEHQVLICPDNTQLHEIAKSKSYTCYSRPFSSEYDIKWIRMIQKVIKKEKIDLILIHNSNAHTLCVLASLFSFRKTPMVFFRTLIKNINTNPFRKWKYNYKHLRKLVCVSQAVIDVLKPAIKDHSRFSIVGSATDVNEFPVQPKRGKLRNELGVSKDTKLVANISAFVPFKDHVTFVKTAKIVKEKMDNVLFLLIGKGELEDEIKNMVKQENMEQDIIFLGFRKDIPEIFPDFDLFLFTSKLEPTGGVLLEAYASKVPIVATNYGGIPEVVINKETGLLCERENPVSFAENVIKLLNDKQLQEKYIANGTKRLKNNFTKEIIAQKMLTELLEVYNNTKSNMK